MLSRELLQSVLNCAPDAMVVVTESGTILFANQQASLLFGYTPGELHGQSVELLVPGGFGWRISVIDCASLINVEHDLWELGPGCWRVARIVPSARWRSASLPFSADWKSSLSRSSAM